MNALINGWRATGVQEKLHILIQGALIVLFFVLMEWVLGRFEVQIERAAETRAEETANGLINGMNMLMLTGQISDPENRKMLLSKMSQSRGVVELRIVRGRAVVEQFGPGLPEEAPVDELDREVLSTGKTLFRKVAGRDGRPALRVVVPFIAKQDFRGTNCLLCHITNAGSVNGAASVTIDLSEEQAQLSEIEDWMWIGHAALQVLLLVLISLFVRVVIVRNITHPVKKLHDAMAEIQSDMNLSRRADVDTNNPDIGEMAKNFNLLVEKLEHANERLQLFVKMFDNSGEAIVITDAQRRIIAVNPAFYRITEYSEEEVIGNDPKILSSGRQDAKFYQAMWRSIEETGMWQGEIWNRRKGGEIYPEWLSIGTVKNAHNEVINYIAVFSDITRRKEADAAAESRVVLGPAETRAAGRDTQPQEERPAVPRPGQVQVRQRHDGASGRRHAAAVRRQPAEILRARVRHHLPPGRRRVHGPAGRNKRGGGCRDGRAQDRQRDAGAAPDRRQGIGHHLQHRHQYLSGRCNGRRDDDQTC